ncbi:MAG: hypothetical protein IPL02_03190 [Moraxellaceae bacterium]|jgi:hypothetical protein|nr:hypothetical protein [Moraxellaceae bacterium]MBK8326090.1 hypothetical protein [Moraxellaceae bacterium]MBK9186332.1 hypothetical protein [Moraxellaceae bacterium]
MLKIIKELKQQNILILSFALATIMPMQSNATAQSYKYSQVIEQTVQTFEDAPDSDRHWSLAAQACDLLQYKGWAGKNCVVSQIVNYPSHGSLVKTASDHYVYTPKKGYLGKDQVKYIVQEGNKKALVTINVCVVEMADDDGNNGCNSF